MIHLARPLPPITISDASEQGRLLVNSTTTSKSFTPPPNTSQLPFKILIFDHPPSSLPYILPHISNHPNPQTTSPPLQPHIPQPHVTPTPNMTAATHATETGYVRASFTPFRPINMGKRTEIWMLDFSTYIVPSATGKRKGWSSLLYLLAGFRTGASVEI